MTDDVTPIAMGATLRRRGAIPITIGSMLMPVGATPTPACSTSHLTDSSDRWERPPGCGLLACRSAGGGAQVFWLVSMLRSCAVLQLCEAVI